VRQRKAGIPQFDTLCDNGARTSGDATNRTEETTGMAPHRPHSDFDLDFDSDSLWEVTWAFEGEAFETLRSLAQEKFYKARTNVFEQGDPPDGMYLVLDGFALVIAKDAIRDIERTVGIVQAGQSFGELGLLVEQPRMACIGGD
jgi:hypothetical protein